MSHHERGYLIGVILLTLVLSVPQGWVCYGIGEMVWWGFPLLPEIPGFANHRTTYSEFSYSSIWRDRFVRVEPDNIKIRAKESYGPVIVSDWKVSLQEPETGERTDTTWELEGDQFVPVVVGDKLFFCGLKKQLEVVDGNLRPVNFPRPDDPLFLLNGEVAKIEQTPRMTSFNVLTCNSGTWGNARHVVLPGSNRELTVGKTTINLQNRAVLKCLNQGDRLHAFLRIDGHLLYRQGLTLRPLEGDGESVTVGNGNDATLAAADELAGWTLVREKASDADSWEHQFGMLVEGQPGALLVDVVETGRPVGHFYKFDGTEWAEVTTLQFPFGSNSFRTILRREDQSPYIVATTATGTGFAYTLEPDGIREIKGQGAALTWFHLKRNLMFHAATLAVAWGLGFLPCFGIWLLMAWFTKPEYGFGAKTVRLASLWRRGLARMIDLALIASVTMAVGWSLLHDIDWLSLAEAMKLQVDHPLIHTATQAVMIMAVSLLSTILILVLWQGCWGVTPGKWLCGLRTVRTTLRPCGIARSLVREALLALDGCYLLYWLPGTLCIAVSTHRQRLGDIVGDTIVIERPTTVELASEDSSST